MSNFLKITRKDMVKKFEKGSTVTCSKCHHKSHKSNNCPQPKKKLSDEKNKKKLTIKSSLIYTKPNQRNKSPSTSYVIKKDKWQGGCSQSWEARKELKSLHLGAQGCHHQHEGPQMVWVPKDTWSPRIGFGGFGGLAYKMMRRFKPKKLSSQLGHLVPKSPIR